MLDIPGSGGPPDAPEPPANTALREALRRARIEAAQQTDVVIDLRATEIARLEILKDELEPVFAQVPREIDMFDVGLVPGDRPRLFVDMVSFIEMGRDRRSYRFMRDGRHGRAVAAESEQTGPIVEAVTIYVARRLIERERLLTDEDRLSLQPETQARPIAPPSSPRTDTPLTPSAAAPAPALASEQASPPQTQTIAETPAARPRRRLLRIISILAAFGVGGMLGGAVVLGLIFAVARGYLPV